MRSMGAASYICRFFGMILVLGVAGLCVAEQEAAIIEGAPLVVRFDNGKTAVGDSDRARLRHYLGECGLKAGDKILVVGHSDNSGESEKNIDLSYQRAQNVRKEIVSGLGMDGRNVVAMGRGDENPVGDNKTQAGRALNRRVEIYLAQVVSGRLKGKDQRVNADRVAVEALVQDAKSKLRRRDINGALGVLHSAREQGGDQVASWHAAYGIAGFYAGIPATSIKAHLRSALTIDPFNVDARDFLGRLTAQEDVAKGAVTSEMGRDEDRPIVIRFASQAHEYLRLFGARPLSHRPAKRRSIEVWTCQESQGRVVSYYFDRSGVYGWAFSPQPKGAGRHRDHQEGSEQDGTLGELSRFSSSDHLASVVAAPHSQARIGESQLYR